MTDVDVNTDENYSRIESVEDDDSDDEEWVEVDWPLVEDDDCVSCECPNDAALPDDCNCRYHTFLCSNNEGHNQRVLQSQNDNNNGNIIDHAAINNPEESDDVSIITDSEIEANIVSKNFSELCNFKAKMYGPLKMFEGQKDESIQIGTPFNTIFCCTLAFCTVGLLALAASRIYSVANTYSVSDNIDFETIKLEADNLITKCKDLNDVKRVLEQIKVNMLRSKRFLKDEKKMLKRKIESKNPFKMLDINSFNSTSNILQQLKTSLNILSTSINEINGTNEVLEMKMYQTQSIISDLHAFQNIMTDLVSKLQNFSKPMEIKFLENAHNEINRVSQSALSHLLQTVYELTIKMYNKFDKIKYKISKRLCCTRNSSPDGEGFLTDLDKDNSFLNSCNEILNLKCDASDKNKEKHKTKNHDANAKHKKFKDTNKDAIIISDESKQDNSQKNTFSKKSVTKRGSIHTERKQVTQGNSEKKADKKCDTISESPLSRNECLVQQSSWIYPEVVSSHGSFGISGLNVNELRSDSSYDVIVANNNNTETKQNITSIRQDNKDLSFSQKENVDVSIYDNVGSNLFDNNIFHINTSENEKDKEKNGEYLDIFDQFQKALNDISNIDDSSKKKKKTKDSSTSKESGYKQKKSPKKSGKSKNWEKVPKSVNNKYRDGGSDNKTPNADWQFQRSRARERVRLLEDAIYNFKDALQDYEDHYTKRYQYRKKARESEEFLNKEREFIDDWLERKDMNTRKYNNGKYSIKFTNRSHRKNILQTKRR